MEPLFEQDELAAPSIWATTGIYRGVVAVVAGGIEFRQVDRLTTEDAPLERWVPEPVVFTKSWSQIGGYETFGFPTTSLSNSDLSILEVEIQPHQADRWRTTLQMNGVVSVDEQLADGGHSEKWAYLPDGRSLVSVRLGSLHSSLVNRYLAGSEHLLVAGEAVWLRVGNRGRIIPIEGLLAITDQHLLFCSMQMNEDDEIFLDRYFVCSVKKKRSIVPNSDRLLLEARRFTGRWEKFEFIASKRTVQEAIETLDHRSRSDTEADHASAVRGLLDGNLNKAGVVWRAGHTPDRAEYTVSVSSENSTDDRLTGLAMKFSDSDGTVIQIRFSELKAFRETGDLSHHRSVRPDFFEGVGGHVSAIFSDGDYRVFQLFFEKDDGSPDSKNRMIALYAGIPLSDATAGTFRWLLRDNGVSQLWPIPEDSIGEDLAIESHARSTLQSGYRGTNPFLREMAPRGDSSQVLAVFPFVAHGGDNGVPRSYLGAVTERSLWLVPHHVAQLEDDPRSGSFINCIEWGNIAGWGHHKPMWGQQIFQVYWFTKQIDPRHTYEEELELQNGLRTVGLLFWGRNDHEYVMELVMKMIAVHGAFDPLSRIKYS